MILEIIKIFKTLATVILPQIDDFIQQWQDNEYIKPRPESQRPGLKNFVEKFYPDEAGWGRTSLTFCNVF